MTTPTWQYGVTTVSDRRNDLLPRTLESLKEAGFPSPRLFVDGSDDPKGWYKQFKLPVTCREPRTRTFGNFCLGLAELWIRDSNADWYAMFQDDFTTVLNLREYLEKVTTPPLSYRNLYTFPSNQTLAPKNKHGGTIDGWYPSNQLGRGAVALVFDNRGVADLLTASHTVMRPKDPHRGWRAIDGGIVDALKKAGYKEFVHSPSLVQHIGRYSTMGNKPHKTAVSYRGEDFDALSLLPENQ